MENVEVKKSSKKPGGAAKITEAEKAGKVGKTKDPRKKKKILCLGVFVVGLIMLVVGAVFMVLNILKGNAVADGEYLVAAGDWVLTDCGEDNCDKVVWDFTEIGKGSLTTDGGGHNYDFKWAIEDGKLLIQTDWLYELNDKYEYSLDQSNGVLTLFEKDAEEDALAEYRFVAQP